VHRLRLTNAGAEAIQKFTLDGHNMTVIANDFVPIIPYQTQGTFVSQDVI
jgi:FtsP/CotA-like multicopper oxidase with cupredoxin domain